MGFSDVDIADDLRKCAICARYFEPTSRLNRYCSKTCAGKASHRLDRLRKGEKRGRPVVPIGAKLTCAECGRWVVKQWDNQKFCGPDCARRAKAKRERARRRRHD